MTALLRLLPAFALAAAATASPAADAPAAPDLATQVAALDAAAFDAFNHCEIPAQLDRYASFFAPDVEFYHDHDGVTWKRDVMIADTKANVCGKFQRELVPGSLKVWPIGDYGALAQGEHRFCHYKPGGTTHPCEGRGAFTIVWHRQGDTWTITRAFSYAHGPD